MRSHLVTRMGMGVWPPFWMGEVGALSPTGSRWGRKVFGRLSAGQLRLVDPGFSINRKQSHAGEVDLGSKALLC